jgi:hypothetical protein
MASDLRFAGDANAARATDYIARARSMLSLPQDSQLELIRVAPDAPGGHLIEYAVTVPVEIHGTEFGVADGVTVDERVTATLRFDGQGKLVSSQVSSIDQHHLDLVKDQIKKLAAADEIGAAGEQRPADSHRKLWRLENDAQGHKRLKRVQIA